MSARTLAELVDIEVGFPFKSAEFTSDTGHPVLLRGDNIGQGFLRWDNAARWSPTMSVPERYHLVDGDLVLAMDRPWIESGLKYARVTRADLPAYLVQRVARLRSKPGVDQGYVACLLGGAAFTEYVRSVQTGTAVPHISARQILDCPVSPHPLPEQQAIAEVLGALDDKIAARTRLAATAEDLAVTLLSGVEASVPLSEVVSVSRSMVSPETLTAPVVAHFSLPAFDSGGGPDRVAPALIKSGKFLVDRPAVLLSKLNPRFPRVWDLAVLPDEPALASTEFVVLHPSVCSTAVLWALVSQPRFGVALEGMVAGTSGSHQRVKPAEVLATPIGDPRTLPVALTERVTTLGGVALSSRAESLALTATRDALLPALMSGTLRVRDAEHLAETVT